ncbi:Influenza virus NS1A-binding protein-A-like protein [Morus notabilis]|uniref:Influenza virus NS1A-binding protein-A-like protein n=1 Tax=Morus notabilis TaxID=981085 RepID=W9QLS9_9ROSA|nr:Influenza virus NS1A-binding protein-A-like protein [Morus notabilis]
MGAGRKTQTFTLQGKTQPQWTSNSSSNWRNLKKQDLGGVIFGCKHSTIKECYSKHDRKLHGIFEAASAGKLNIDPYGWTADRSDYSPYAAQVRIQIRKPCRPLPEDQFGPIITENYYESKHFYFELDRVQAEKLISLFSSFPTASTPFPMNAKRRSTPSKASSRSKTSQEGDIIESNTWNSSYPNQGNTECGSSGDGRPGLGAESQMTGMVSKDWEVEKDKHDGRSLETLRVGRSNSAVVRNIDASAGNPSHSNMGFCNATDLACDSRLLEVGNEEESGGESWGLEASYHKEAAQNCQMQAVGETQSHDHPYCPTVQTQNIKLSVPESRNVSDSGQSDWGWESPRFDSSFDGNIKFLEDLVDDSQTSQEHMDLGLNSDIPNSFIMTKETTTFTLCPQNQGREYTTEAPELNSSYQKIAKTQWSVSCVAPHLDNESPSSEAVAEEDTNDVIDEEHIDFQSNGEYTSFPAAITVSNNHLWDEAGVTGMMSNGPRSPETANISEMVSSIVAKLLDEVKELRSSHLAQVQKISLLEHDMVKSRLEIQLLKDRCKKLESRSSEKTGNVKEKVLEPFIDPRQELEESILLVGGFDGSSWLSALDCYHPSLDHMESFSPMSLVRSHASAAKLNGEVYVFGGVYENLWYDEVESYNPVRNTWTRRPSLNQRKGGLAGVSFNDTIYAIGGGNGAECFSEVEIYHLGIGRWIPTQSMLHKRFSPAAAEINRAIYVVGGYDGKNYLNSMERFDPRECSWTRLGSMSTRRGCHSLAVLNDKLFAMGGYDGGKIVSTVEVFDPRKGSWMMGDSMNSCRGYSPAVVFGDAIYAIGGLKKGDEILDTVECYKEGLGWQVTNLKAIGKRCFFSAIVL